MSGDRRGFEWFPFYAGRFLSSRRVRRMDATHVGIYLLLMIEQWEHGAVPDDNAELAFIGRCTADEARDVLRECFRQTEAGWINDRLEGIRGEQIAKASQAKNAAEARWGKSARNADALPLEEEVEGEVEREVTTASSVARMVADFCLVTGAGWKLRADIPQWSEGIVREPKYVGADLLYEIRKCTDWHVGKGKAPKAPDQAIRNWLEKASKNQRPQPNGHQPRKNKDAPRIGLNHGRHVVEGD